MVLKPANPRPSHQRARITVAETATTTIARMSARSTISGTAQDAAPTQLRHDETQRAEVEARIKRHHHRDGKREHPGYDGVARQQRRGGEQQDRPAQDPRAPPGLV